MLLEPSLFQAFKMRHLQACLCCVENIADHNNLFDPIRAFCVVERVASANKGNGTTHAPSRYTSQ